MTYENFLKVILQLQKQERVIKDLYSLNLDLIEFVDPYAQITTLLFKEIYGEEGEGWISWFCYENDYGTKGLEAFDKDGNPICYSFESLWKYLEDNY